MDDSFITPIVHWGVSHPLATSLIVGSVAFVAHVAILVRLDLRSLGADVRGLKVRAEGRSDG